MSGAISRPPFTANDPSFQVCEYLRIGLGMKSLPTGGQKSSCISMTSKAGL